MAGLPKEYNVLVTILGTLKQTQSLDELLPSMLQMEQQIRADERETLPIYGARDGIRRKQPRQNQQRTAGQTDLDSKAAATIVARRATWNQSAVLASRISKASAQ